MSIQSYVWRRHSIATPEHTIRTFQKLLALENDLPPSPAASPVPGTLHTPIASPGILGSSSASPAVSSESRKLSRIRSAVAKDWQKHKKKQKDLKMIQQKQLGILGIVKSTSTGSGGSDSSSRSASNAIIAPTRGQGPRRGRVRGRRSSLVMDPAATPKPSTVETSTREKIRHLLEFWERATKRLSPNGFRGPLNQSPAPVRSGMVRGLVNRFRRRSEMSERLSLFTPERIAVRRSTQISEEPEEKLGPDKQTLGYSQQMLEEVIAEEEGDTISEARVPFKDYSQETESPPSTPSPTTPPPTTPKASESVKLDPKALPPTISPSLRSRLRKIASVGEPAPSRVAKDGYEPIAWEKLRSPRSSVNTITSEWSRVSGPEPSTSNPNSPLRSYEMYKTAVSSVETELAQQPQGTEVELIQERSPPPNVVPNPRTSSPKPPPGPAFFHSPVHPWLGERDPRRRRHVPPSLYYDNGSGSELGSNLFPTQSEKRVTSVRKELFDWLLSQKDEDLLGRNSK